MTGEMLAELAEVTLTVILLGIAGGGAVVLLLQACGFHPSEPSR